MNKGSVDKGIELQWANVLESLRGEVGEDAYKSWLKPMVVREVNDGQINITVPTRFMRDWVVAHYLDKLNQLWAHENPDIKAVNVFVQPDQAVKLTSENAGKATIEAAQSQAGAAKNNGLDYQKEISAPLDPRFAFDQFVVGKPNEFAYAAARRVAEASTV
ncbi:MAG: DnaA N-terminal domain-containing protein, partial [Rhodospirillales bacterium]